MPATTAAHIDRADASPRVVILLGAKDGARFLRDQLCSFARQLHKNWALIVSDDGSRDASRDIVARFAAGLEQPVSLGDGPGKGVCANFLSLAADPTIEGDYFAFSDQDDVWYDDKLTRALAWLSAVPPAVPALYFGRTELITADGRPCGFSPLFTRPPLFRNALVQNMAGGNTMVFNRAAKKLLEAAGTLDVVLHDWWVYQLVSAAGGEVHYDAEPVLRYRQHDDNLLGSNRGWRAALDRLRMMLHGRFREWNDKNIAALRRLPAHLITPENRAVLDAFAQARAGPFAKRLRNLRRSGVYRQRWFGNLALLLASVLGKI
jgi:glycosyltransferase involved in cell wall biosynthesis